MKQRGKNKKNQKKLGQPQGPLGQCEMPQHSNHRVPEEEDKKKGHEKILKEIIAENFPKMGKEIATQVQET